MTSGYDRQQGISPEDYLRDERDRDIRHEYVDG